MAGLEDPSSAALTSSLQPIPRSCLARPALQVAPDLLGAVVVHESSDGTVAVRLTEVEAYEGQADPGSHAFRGRTARNEVMFGEAGHLYVYFTYGMHWCTNVVCGEEGRASAVLLRAGEVVGGLDLARARRLAARTDRDLARGPARLAQALGLTREHNGDDVCSSRGRLRLLPGAAGASGLVRTGPRVGVRGVGGDAEVHPWRFWLDGEPSVSVYRPAQPRRRASR
ncbi:MAG: DNA-3-methyladenine glycosylase [Actinomycetes bacterium]